MRTSGCGSGVFLGFGAGSKTQALAGVMPHCSLYVASSYDRVLGFGVRGFRAGFRV